MTEIELIEKAARKVGMTSLLNHGAASCVYSEGCNGVTQEHLVAFAREVALHCASALGVPAGYRLQPISEFDAFNEVIAGAERDLAYYKNIAERCTDRALKTAGASGPFGDPEVTG